MNLRFFFSFLPSFIKTLAEGIKRGGRLGRINGRRLRAIRAFLLKINIVVYHSRHLYVYSNYPSTPFRPLVFSRVNQNRKRYCLQYFITLGRYAIPTHQPLASYETTHWFRWNNIIISIRVKQNIKFKCNNTDRSSASAILC